MAAAGQAGCQEPGTILWEQFADLLYLPLQLLIRTCSARGTCTTGPALTAWWR